SRHQYVIGASLVIAAGYIVVDRGVLIIAAMAVGEGGTQIGVVGEILVDIEVDARRASLVEAASLVMLQPANPELSLRLAMEGADQVGIAGDVFQRVLRQAVLEIAAVDEVRCRRVVIVAEG